MEQVWLAWPPGGHLTGPSDLGISRATADLPLKHWGSVLSFLWERTVLLLQVPMAKTGIPPPNILICKDCSQMKSARTDSSGWLGHLGATSHLPLKHWDHVLFFPMGRKHHPCPGAHGQTGNALPEFPISKDSSLTKAARTDRSGWPWLPEGWLSCAFETLGLRAFIPNKKNSSSRRGAHDQN